MIKKYVYKIDKSSPSDFEIIGGKASALIEMSFSNIDIPEGFIITTECFRDCFDRVNEKFELTQSIENEILSAYDEFIGDTLVAVRSSATVEDQSEYSYAGKFETILHVPKDKLIGKIISVWKSSQLADADYNKKNNKEVQMGIVVQRMLKTNYSGVIFTRYPYQESQNMNIELVKGLPDVLVAGKVTPTQILVNRENLGFKIQKSYSSLVIKRIVEWAFEIENKFGKPCDIEWGMENNRLYLLQVRPITSRRTVQSNSLFNSFHGKANSFDEWTQGNVSEVLPRIMTPLSWSILGESLNELLRKSFRAQKNSTLANSTCFIQLKEGELYYNIGAVNYFTNQIMGFPTMNEVVGGNHIKENEIDRITINWFKVMKNIKSVSRSNNTFKQLALISNQETINIKRTVKEWCNIQLEELSSSDLFTLFDEISNYVTEKMTLHTDATAASFSYKGILQYLINKWLNPAIKSVDLLSNISGVEIVEITNYIDDLINEIKKTGNEEIIVNSFSSNNWRANLIKEGFIDFKERTEEIFTKFGHRGWEEIELSNPTWAMDESYILKMIIAGLKAPLNSSAKKEPDDNYETSLNKVHSKLKSNTLKKKIFLHILTEARFYTKLRENNKHTLYLIIQQLKLVIKELARRIYQSRMIKQENDIYFITINEVKNILLGSSEYNIKRLIDERQNQFENHIKSNKAHTVTKNIALSNNTKRLKGLTACTGLIRGRAKIIYSIDEVENIAPGDILVVKTLDIGWTPIFSKISGLVTEVGGTLSHASIIAREYGLPTVVNVPNALSIITNNDLIEVNADNGEVAIISTKDITNG